MGKDLEQYSTMDDVTDKTSGNDTHDQEKEIISPEEIVLGCASFCSSIDEYDPDDPKLRDIRCRFADQANQAAKVLPEGIFPVYYSLFKKTKMYIEYIEIVRFLDNETNQFGPKNPDSNECYFKSIRDEAKKQNYDTACKLAGDISNIPARDKAFFIIAYALAKDKMLQNPPIRHEDVNKICQITDRIADPHLKCQFFLILARKRLLFAFLNAAKAAKCINNKDLRKLVFLTLTNIYARSDYYEGNVLSRIQLSSHGNLIKKEHYNCALGVLVKKIIESINCYKDEGRDPDSLTFNLLLELADLVISEFDDPDVRTEYSSKIPELKQK